MKKKRAFTMVELIFVIVILGILAAVAVPKLNASREDAQVATILTDARTLWGDIHAYYAAQGEITKNFDFSKITNVPLVKKGSAQSTNENDYVYRPLDKPCLLIVAPEDGKVNLGFHKDWPSENPACKEALEKMDFARANNLKDGKLLSLKEVAANLKANLVGGVWAGVQIDFTADLVDFN